MNICYQKLYPIFFKIILTQFCGASRRPLSFFTTILSDINYKEKIVENFYKSVMREQFSNDLYSSPQPHGVVQNEHFRTIAASNTTDTNTIYISDTCFKERFYISIKFCIKCLSFTVKVI